MTTQDISSLIDWTSPTVEYICKPLIPLPNFDGQPVIDGDNPFDAVEKQIDMNEPFDMVLNQSLNSSSEQIDLDKSMKKSDESNSVTRIINIFDGLNVHDNESAHESPSKNEPCYPADVSNVLDVSSIGSDVSEVQILRKRLSTILDQFSKPNDDVHVSKVTSDDPPAPFLPSSLEISCFSPKSSSKGCSSSDATNPSVINKAFIGRNLSKDGSFDSLMFNVNHLYEDLSSVSPAWDELVLTFSSSDEELEISPMKNIPTKNATSLKSKASAEKMIKKSCPRLPLGSKDPNIRTKRTINFVKETGPLKAVIPIESMARNVNQKLVETPKNTRFSRKLKLDSALLKSKQRSVPVATSTPVGLSPNLTSKSKSAMKSKSSTPSVNSSKSSKLSTPSINTSRSKSCPPSPDSTSTLFVSKPINSRVKICSRKLALNAVSSSSNSFSYLSNNKKSSKDVKYASLNSSYKSTATGVKSCVKNKENLVPFRF